MCWPVAGNITSREQVAFLLVTIPSKLEANALTGNPELRHLQRLHLKSSPTSHCKQTPREPA